MVPSFILEPVLRCHFPAETGMESAGASLLRSADSCRWAVERKPLMEQRITARARAGRLPLLLGGSRNKQPRSLRLLCWCSSSAPSYSWSRLNHLAAVNDLGWEIIICSLRPRLVVRQLFSIFFNFYFFLNRWIPFLLANAGLALER